MATWRLRRTCFCWFVVGFPGRNYKTLRYYPKRNCIGVSRYIDPLGDKRTACCCRLAAQVYGLLEGPLVRVLAGAQGRCRSYPGIQGRQQDYVSVIEDSGIYGRV